MYIKSYKDLIVWQKSMKLARDIFLLTDGFPSSEQFGITSQMRRASVSIPSNIAEGYARKSSKEYSQFCSIAYGSTLELETQLILSKELSFGDEEKRHAAYQLVQEVAKMLNVMTAKISNPRR